MQSAALESLENDLCPCCHEMRTLGIWQIFNQSLPVSFLQFSVSAEPQSLTINSSSAVKDRKPSGNETNFRQQLISRYSSATRSPSHSGRTSRSVQLSIFSFRTMLRCLMASGKTRSLSQCSMVRSSSFGLCCSKFQSHDDAWHSLIHSLLRSDADFEDDGPNILPTDNISLLLDSDKSAIASGRHGFGLIFGHPLAVTVLRTGNMNTCC